MLVEDISCLCTKQTRKNLTTSTTITRQIVDARTGKNRFVRVCTWVGGWMCVRGWVCVRVRGCVCVGGGFGNMGN